MRIRNVKIKSYNTNRMSLHLQNLCHTIYRCLFRQQSSAIPSFLKQYCLVSIITQCLALSLVLLETTDATNSLMAGLGISIFLQTLLSLVYLALWVLQHFEISWDRLKDMAGLPMMLFLIGSAVSLRAYLPAAIWDSSPATLIGLSCLLTVSALPLLIQTQVAQCWQNRAAIAEERQSYCTLRHHFLFNTLNTTVYLIRTNPGLAEDILLKLAALYRSLLQQSPTITLQEEIAVTKDYLAIEQTRLGSRLRVEWILPASVPLSMPFPPLLLQPLVENAVYHGIESGAGSGTITISIELHNNYLHVHLRNPCSKDINQSSAGNQIAQTLVRQRLRRLYGNLFQLRLQHSQQHYSVDFEIPYRRHNYEHTDH